MLCPLTGKADQGRGLISHNARTNGQINARAVHNNALNNHCGEILNDARSSDHNREEGTHNEIRINNVINLLTKIRRHH